MGYNAGFARANNAGISSCAGDTVLLLNPDTIILNDSINECLNRFLKAEEIACSVQLLNPDNSPQITGNYFMKGGLNYLLPLPYLGKLLREIAFLFNAKKTSVMQANHAQEVDWINGAFLMVKKSAIEKAGLMDEDFFLYAEEAEWCYRLKKCGSLVVYGDLHAIHLQGEIINKASNSADKGYFNLYDKKGLQLMVSNTLRIRKQYGSVWFMFHLFFYIIEIPLFLLCNFFQNIIRFQNPSRNWSLVYGYTKNVFALVRLSRDIIAGKHRLYKMI
jgi:GT2 family glycosyltransferase